MTPEELRRGREAIGGLAYTGESRAGEEVDRRSRSRIRRRSTRSARAGPDRPGDAARRRRVLELRPRRARGSSSSAARALDGRAAAGGADSRVGPYSTKEQEDALERIGRSLLARRRPLPGDRVDAPPRAVRPRRADERPRRADGAAALARRPPPRHPGAARLGQDVDVGAPDRAAGRRGQEGRRRLDEPPRDPQAARGGREAARPSSGSTSAG